MLNMHFDAHCSQSIAFLGNPWPSVHIWLDEFAGRSGIGMKHRRFRHHQEGIEEVRKIWGHQAAEAARMHIISDLSMDQWDPNRDPMPKNEADYVSMGLF